MRQSILACLAICLQPSTGTAQASTDTVAYVGAAVVDVASGTVQLDATVVVADGHIVELRDGNDSSGVASVVTLDGGYIVPGLVDAHVHFPDSAAAHRALLTGVTSARIMGSWDFAGVALRQLARSDPGRYPAIRASGYHIRRTMPAQFDSLLGGDRVRDRADLARVVRMQLEHGVDAVKIGGDSTLAPEATPSIWALRWRRLLRALRLAPAIEDQPLSDFDTGPRYAPMFSEEDFALVVELATDVGVPVVVHAMGDQSARSATLAGVRSIEHGTWLTDSTLSLMAQRQVYFVPSLSLAEFRGHGTVDRVRAVVREAHRLGVPIAAGSDTDYFHDGPTLAQELQAMVRAGLTPAQALRAGTVGGATLLGWGAMAGEIKVGYQADFVVVESDPLQDLATLDRPVLVVNDGVQVR
jgi:imidazolonepropionase-like amidohydrolase